MKEYTTLDRIKDFLLAPYRSMEYFFAKRWLDSNFGKREFWGDFLSELIYKEDYDKLRNK